MKWDDVNEVLKKKIHVHVIMPAYIIINLEESLKN